MTPKFVSIDELTELVAQVLIRHGVRPDNAGPVAEAVVAAERDGGLSHGLLRLPGYVATLTSGWVDGQGEPRVADSAPGLVATGAANGFAQPALRASAPLLRDKARRQGIAAVAIRNSHHFAALWVDIEPFVADGFIALAAANGRRRIVVWDGKRKILGTNPLAFGCPRSGRPPLIWGPGVERHCAGRGAGPARLVDLLFFRAKGLSPARGHDSTYLRGFEDWKACGGAGAGTLSHRHKRTKKHIEYLYRYRRCVRTRGICGI